MSEIESSNNSCNQYTGFTTHERLSSVFEFLNPGVNGENVVMYANQTASAGGARPRAMTPYICFLVTVIRLRRSFSIKHLAFLFQVAESTISNTVTTWVNFMYIRLRSVSI